MGSETERYSHEPQPGLMRRTVGGAYDATFGRVTDRVSETARGITGATARQVVDELEPYLIAEAIPRIVDGLVPYLTENLVPEVVDGVTTHIAETTVGDVMTGATSTLVEDNLPVLLEQLRPYLERELVPAIVTAMLPYINDEVAPSVVQAMMPTILDDLAPAVVDALMPKIRAEVVPAILDDIVDDPKVRDLIREQSQGMILDGLERLRKAMARADQIVENIFRRVVGKGPRPVAGPGELQPLPGRTYVHAGIVSRGVALALDIFVVGFLVNASVSSILSILESLLGPLPSWFVALVVAIGFTAFPIYLAVGWTLLGRTLGDTVVGLRVGAPDGTYLRLGRSLFRAVLLFLFLFGWVAGMVMSPFTRARRGLLDLLTGVTVRYHVYGESYGGDDVHGG